MDNLDMPCGARWLRQTILKFFKLAQSHTVCARLILNRIVQP